MMYKVCCCVCGALSPYLPFTGSWEVAFLHLSTSLCQLHLLVYGFLPFISISSLNAHAKCSLKVYGCTNCVKQQAFCISVQVVNCRKEAFIAMRNLYFVFSNASPCKVHLLFYLTAVTYQIK